MKKPVVGILLVFLTNFSKIFIKCFHIHLNYIYIILIFSDFVNCFTQFLPLLSKKLAKFYKIRYNNSILKKEKNDVATKYFCFTRRYYIR